MLKHKSRLKITLYLPPCKVYPKKNDSSNFICYISPCSFNSNIKVRKGAYMAQAKHGDTVQIHYTGKLDDGFVFDTSLEREPLEFQIGGGFVLEGFEQAVIDMNPGDSKTFTISAENAYGPYRQEMVMLVPKEQIPPHITPEIGQQIQINDKELAQPMVVSITNISDEGITLDANHPLAGRDLTFEIKLVAINS